MPVFKPIFGVLFRGDGARVSWTLLERAVSVVLSFLGTLLVSRYLGPSNFGVLSYVLALFAIANIIAQLGLSGLVVRDLSLPQAEAQGIISTTLGLRIIGSAFAIALLLSAAIIMEGVDSPLVPLALSAAVVLALRPTDVLDFWFQSKAEFVTLAKLRLLASVGGFFGKVLLIVLGAGLVNFALPMAGQALILGLLLYLAFRKEGLHLRLRPAIQGGWAWLRQSWSLMLSSLAAIVYLKIDQIMLQHYVGSEAVGIYAIAATLSESWYLLSGAVVTALFPKLVVLRSESRQDFDSAFQRLLDGLFLSALVVALVTQAGANFFVTSLFGPLYAAASDILAVHIWSGVFVFMREAFSRWIIIERALGFSLITHGLGMIFNVGLNIFLIPSFEGLGAAYATLLSYAIASYLSLFLHKKTRAVFYMMSRSLVFPFRIILARI